MFVRKDSYLIDSIRLALIPDSSESGNQYSTNPVETELDPCLSSWLAQSGIWQLFVFSRRKGNNQEYATFLNKQLNNFSPSKELCFLGLCTHQITNIST